MEEKMQTLSNNKIQQNELGDTITIIAPSVKEAMMQFKVRGLDVLGYAIAGKIVRQEFSLVGGLKSEPMFDGKPMFSATWVRKT